MLIGRILSNVYGTKTLRGDQRGHLHERRRGADFRTFASECDPISFLLKYMYSSFVLRLAMRTSSAQSPFVLWPSRKQIAARERNAARFGDGVNVGIAMNAAKKKHRERRYKASKQWVILGKVSLFIARLHRPTLASERALQVCMTLPMEAVSVA